MKSFQVIFMILLAGLSACHVSNDTIIIQGEIIGDIPDKVEYTHPVSGVCNWWFTKSVLPDSLGKFQLVVASKEAVFIKIRTSGSQKGTLIAEPGNIYQVLFNLKDKQNVFSVNGKGSEIQQTCQKFPDPEHIQVGAREFLRDSIAPRVKETIDQRRTAEIIEIEKLLSEKVISPEVSRLVITDRNCYYDALLATIAWIRNLRAIQGRGEMFTLDYANLWKETFRQPLVSNPEIVKSPWFPYYAESYIYFREYVNGNFTKERLEELREANQVKTYHVDKAKEYLPSRICADYLANYLYQESFQKKFEKELIGLFNDFKTNYPESGYIPYISPLVDEISEFYRIAAAGFSEKMKFVEAYQDLNTLSDVAVFLPKGIIYVDVWATWCGPCKAEFKHREELQELLKENGIPILYLSIDRNEDSVQWKNMIKYYQLEGFHIRANKELDAELRKIFDRQGSISIPWYILMNSEGKILKKRASRPSRITELEQEIHEIKKL
jgi:thiol-disulfide isomerase/thioredoxin